MNLAVIGAGYVGLVTAACFAEMGHNVSCMDVDAARIGSLSQGIVPISEPGLQSLVASNARAGRLRFTSSVVDAIPGHTVFFIAVGTPPGADSSADVRQVLEVARQIGLHMEDYGVVVGKSTVPVGTAEKIGQVIREELAARGRAIPFDVVSNPEFLKEGSAVGDFMSPDRVIIGSDSDTARAIMRDLYAPFMRTHERMLFMGVREAEMTKYTANAMLSARISFMNEIANLCDRLGVDVESVRLGVGADRRIGYAFIYPGCGYGGSCLPKDVRALIKLAEEHTYDPLVLRAIDQRNKLQKGVLFEKITGRFGEDLKGHRFALWGLSFKPETDDLREAPSLDLLRQLIEAGAEIKAYDPVAMDAARRQLPATWFEQHQLQLVERHYDAVSQADALILTTEWRIFRNPDLDYLARTMRQRVIFDGRNQYDPARIRQHGFEYTGIGR
jgi:UDPglucose 6-dehydrogenase